MAMLNNQMVIYFILYHIYTVYLVYLCHATTQ